MKIIFSYGIIITACFIGWTFLEFALGWHNEQLRLGLISGLMSMIIPVVLIFLGIRASRSAIPDQKFSWMRGFGTGAGISLVMSVLTGGFLLYYLQVFNPESVDAILMECTSYLEQKSLDFESMMRLLDIFNFIFSTKGILICFALPQFLAGLGLSALYAVFLRRKN